MRSQCIVIDYMQLPTIYKCSIVAMETQQYVPFALLSRFKMFRTAVNNTNVPRCHAQWPIFLFDLNQIRLLLTYFRKSVTFRENPSTGSSDDTCDQKDWRTDRQDVAKGRFSQLKRTHLNLCFLRMCICKFRTIAKIISHFSLYRIYRLFCGRRTVPCEEWTGSLKHNVDLQPS